MRLAAALVAAALTLVFITSPGWLRRAGPRVYLPLAFVAIAVGGLLLADGITGGDVL